MVQCLLYLYNWFLHKLCSECSHKYMCHFLVHLHSDSSEDMGLE